MPKAIVNKNWYLYIVKCSDDTLYTGISVDIPSRIAKHNSGKGAKYVRTRLPVELVYSETFETQKQAILREIYIKSWPKQRKLKLFST
jgi:putative endonuclease